MWRRGGGWRRTAASVNLPQFLKVDVKAMKVQSEETGRDSPIRNVEHQDGNLIIQGGQNGRGWTMTISEDRGLMSGVVTAAGEGFVLFGACAVPYRPSPGPRAETRASD